MASKTVTRSICVLLPIDEEYLPYRLNSSTNLNDSRFTSQRKIVLLFYSNFFSQVISRWNIFRDWGQFASGGVSTTIIFSCHSRRSKNPFFLNSDCFGSCRVFSLTWPASIQIYWNKRKRLHKKRVQLPKDWIGTPTWPLFILLEHQYGCCHVMGKTLYI